MSSESGSLLSLSPSPSERLGLRSGSPAAAGGGTALGAAGSGSGGGSLSFWAWASLECRHFIRRFWNHTFTCGRAALRRAHGTAQKPRSAAGVGQRGEAWGAALIFLILILIPIPIPIPILILILVPIPIPIPILLYPHLYTTRVTVLLFMAFFSIAVCAF